jgi:signal transduction histidine kinase
MVHTLHSQPASDFSKESVLHAIAHEIRQPLSTIESIAYYLSLVLDDDKHREQLARVQQLVEQANWILSNGVELADPRRAAPVPVDLGDLLTQTVLDRPAAVDPPVKFELAVDLPPVHLDPWFARALIENILGLFRQLATEEHPMLLKTTAAENGVELDVSTAAPGHRSIESLPPGSALSLDSASRLAALHGGSCTWSIDPASGIRVRVMLP